MPTRPTPPPRRCSSQAASRASCAIRSYPRHLLAASLLLCLAWLAGCASQPLAATPTPSPFPTFDLNDLPPPADVTPAAVLSYLAEVAAFTNPGIIGAAPVFSTERLDGIVTTLEG